MRILLAIFCLASALLSASSASAQSTSSRITYGPCSITNIRHNIDAEYAAAVGVMSTDDAARARLLGSSRSRSDAALCTFQVSEAFCNKPFLEFAVTALSSSMLGGGAGGYFYRALDAAEAAEDPAGNAIGLVAGLGGAILGGITGSGDGLGGTLKGAAQGGLIGFGTGTYLGSQASLNRCNAAQAGFTDLTRRLLAAGLAPQVHHRALFGEIRRVSRSFSAQEQETAEAMIEAMAVASAKIASIR